MSACALQAITFTSSRRIMGDAFVNLPAVTACAWVVSGLVIAVNAWLTYLAAAEHLSQSPISIAGLCVGVAAYLGFVLYLIIGPERFAAWTSAKHDAAPLANTKDAEHADGGADGVIDPEASRLCD